MNFEDLYTIKNKLENIYQKLDAFKENSYDSTEIERAFKSIDKYLQMYEDVNNSLSSPTMALKQDKTISSMLKLTCSLESYVNSVYSSFKIFDDIKKVENIFNSKVPTKEETEECLKLILNDLIDYRKIVNQGKFTSSRYETELVPTLYKLIKSETKYTGSSTLLTTLERFGLDTKGINELLIIEAENLVFSDKNSSQKISNLINCDKVDRELLLYVSIKNDNYLEEIKKLIKNKKESLEYDMKNYNGILQARKEAINRYRKELIKAKNNIIKRILPLLLSISMLFGANGAMAEATKNYSKKTGTTFSTLDGMYDYEDYNSIKLSNGDVLVEYYSNIRTDGNREYRRYVIPANDVQTKYSGFITTDEEFNSQLLEPSEKYLISKDSNYNENKDFPINEFTKVTQINSVRRDAATYLPIIVLHLLATALWFIFDLLLGLSSKNIKFGCLFPCKDGLLESIDEIKEAIDELNNLKDGILSNTDGKYTKEELAKYKETIQMSQKEYDNLLKENSHITKMLKLK